jgi:uridine phosphorylase
MTFEKPISRMHAEEDSCVIDPKKSRREQILPPLAILVFVPEDLALFAACLAKPLRRSHKLYLSDVFTGTFEGVPIALAGPILGAPQAVLILEKMIALGVRKFIAAGWCGSLRKQVQIGDIVLPADAISEEGTSSHYPGAACAPSGALIESLRFSLTSSDLKIHEGTVWTTDAPFRETHAKLKAFQSQGVLCVDMETSALFTVSRFRGTDFAAVLVVSDDLSGTKWVHGFRDPVFHESRKKVIKPTLIAICGADDALTA